MGMFHAPPRCHSWCAAGKITGDVRVSGYPKVQETFARVIGYVEQSDIHSAHVSGHPPCCCSLCLVPAVLFCPMSTAVI